MDAGRRGAGLGQPCALTLILGSVQLLVLGVFGEYLGRMYMEAKARPLFIVSEVRRHPIAANEEPEALAEGGMIEAKRNEGFRVAG